MAVQTEDIFWRVFEATGWIWAYLAFRRFTLRPLLTEVSLN